MELSIFAALKFSFTFLEIMIATCAIEWDVTNMNDVKANAHVSASSLRIV